MSDSDTAAFLPSKLDIFALIFAAATILCVINIKQIISFLVGDTETNVSAEVFPIVQNFILESLAWMTASGATFLFWLVAGFLILMLCQSVIWLFQLYRQDMPTMHLLRSAVQKNTISYIALHFLIRTAALIGLIFWTLWFFVGALPAANRLYLGGLEYGFGIYKTVLACILLALYFYLAGVLLRFLILRRQLFQ